MRRFLISVLIVATCASTNLCAQENEPSLGEVAREARKAKVPENPSAGQTVIDNDNFASVLSAAEAAHVTGKPVFSIDPSGSAFRMTSPDGTCSLSFNAKATALITSPFVSTDLPQDELPKLEGHALIHDDIVEISVHNGTPWEVREVVIGITVLQKAMKLDDLTVPMVVSDPSWTGKSPDSTMIYHLRGSAAANTTATFTAVLGADSNIFSGNADWHWALVSARGLPPGGPVNVQAGSAAATSTQPEATAPVSAVTPTIPSENPTAERRR